jgi:hypothetical protein
VITPRQAVVIAVLFVLGVVGWIVLLAVGGYRG